MKGNAITSWNAVCGDCGWVNSNSSLLCSKCYVSLANPAVQSPSTTTYSSAIPVSDVRHPRCFAGIWFAVAGGIAGSPTLLFLGLIEREGVTLLLALMMAALPATIAGLIGAHFGSGILTSPRVVSRPRAALRGMCVGAGSLAFYLFLLADLGSSSSHESFPAILLMLELVGFILAGWLVCIVGAFAGFLFFHEYRAEKIKEAKRWQALSSC